MVRSLALILLWSACASDEVPWVAPRVCEDTEVFYDGIDGACDGGDDFDADGDGFPLDVDCHDFDASVYPGAPGEVPYDGVDTDCAGDNDFDADGDGWYPVIYAGDFAEYVFNYLDEIAPDDQPGDCDDARADVHPQADDAPYDGLDADCGGDDDYDVDGDGFTAIGFMGLGSGMPGDCDDLSSGSNPSRSERPQTTADEDCSGDGSAPALMVLPEVFEGLSDVQFSRGPAYSQLILDVQAVPGFGVSRASIVSYGGWLDGPRDHPELTWIMDGGRPFDRRVEGGVLEVVAFSEGRAQTVKLEQLLGWPSVVTEESVRSVDAVGWPVFTWDGPLICGPERSVLDGVVFPGAEWCGPWEKGVVFCDPDCMLHERTVTPMGMRTPQRLERDWMLVNGVLQTLQGDVLLPYSDVVDADVDGQHLAWIRDGEVYLRGPWGDRGPLEAHRWRGSDEAEVPERVGFEAERVFLFAEGLQLHVWVVGRAEEGIRVAFARTSL